MPPLPPKPSALRWLVAGMLFLATVLNYVDKNTLSLLAPTIQGELGLSDQAYANIQNAFQGPIRTGISSPPACISRRSRF
ncbi:MAG: hypothetical protein NTV49_09915 [Kiritimatiellaeota bacterium]|nr:hypothetical protein [Kiritimatiellota bacterium]